MGTHTRILIVAALAGCIHTDRIAAPALAEALATRPDAFAVVDVRSQREWQGKKGHIPGAAHHAYPGILHDAELHVPDDRTIVLVCFTGHRSRWSMKAVRAANPNQVIDLEGGMISWWKHDLPAEVEPEVSER